MKNLQVEKKYVVKFTFGIECEEGDYFEFDDLQSAWNYYKWNHAYDCSDYTWQRTYKPQAVWTVKRTPHKRHGFVKIDPLPF